MDTKGKPAEVKPMSQVPTTSLSPPASHGAKWVGVGDTRPEK